MTPDKLPFWVQNVQALGPTLVAIVVGAFASWIAAQQWRTARDKLRLDLFEKRWVIYETLNTIIANTLSRGAITLGEVDDFYRRTKGSEFLFDRSINAYILEVRRALVQLATATSQIEDRDGGVRTDAIAEARKLKDWFEEQALHVVSAKFEKFLSFGHLVRGKP